MSQLALANGVVAGMLIVFQLLKKVFLGSLRDAEVETITEQAWFTAFETCLALPVFNQELSASFVFLFGLLMSVKVFHWLVVGRVDLLEHTPNMSLGRHFRLMNFMTVLTVCDTLFLYWSITEVLANGPSVQILFGYESIILLSTMLGAFVKYAIYIVDVSMEGGWRSKGTATFYLELATSLFQLTVYLVLFVVITRTFRFPLHLMRDVYKAFQSFRQRIVDFIGYRRASARVYPDATPEELERNDRTCVICRDEMDAAKKLPCGHLFHADCLRSWLERQQTCPTCRVSVVEEERREARAEQQGQQQGQQQQQDQQQPQQQDQQPPQPQQQQQQQNLPQDQTAPAPPAAAAAVAVANLTPEEEEAQDRAEAAAAAMQAAQQVMNQYLLSQQFGRSFGSPAPNSGSAGAGAGPSSSSPFLGSTGQRAGSSQPASVTGSPFIFSGLGGGGGGGGNSAGYQGSPAFSAHSHQSLLEAEREKVNQLVECVVAMKETQNQMLEVMQQQALILKKLSESEK